MQLLLKKLPAFLDNQQNDQHPKGIRQVPIAASEMKIHVVTATEELEIAKQPFKLLHIKTQ